MTKNILLTGVWWPGNDFGKPPFDPWLARQWLRRENERSAWHVPARRSRTNPCAIRAKKSGRPVVSKKKGDIIIGFEELEVLRNLEYLRDDGEGVVILNRARVNPIGVLSGKDVYPPNIQELIEARAGRVIALDATEEAEKLGNPRTMNIILLGVALKALGLAR